MTERMWCDQCKEWIIPVEGVTAFIDRREWWCAKHARIHHWENGRPYVDFPSPGKLMPKTIIHKGD